MAANDSDFPAALEQYLRAQPQLTTITTARLTKETCKILYVLFTALDTNNNGGLDTQDFMAFSGGISKFQQLRSKLDFNGDGLIEFNEFVEGMKKLASDMVPENIEIRKDFSINDYFRQFEYIFNTCIRQLAKEMVDFVNSRRQGFVARVGTC